VKSFLGNFYRHLAIFSGHTGLKQYGRQNEAQNWSFLQRKGQDEKERESFFGNLIGGRVTFSVT